MRVLVLMAEQTDKQASCAIETQLQHLADKVLQLCRARACFYTCLRSCVRVVMTTPNRRNMSERCRL